MNKGLRVKYLLFFSVLRETWILSTDFERSSNIKFHDNLSSGRRVVPCGRRHRNDECLFSEFCEHA